MEANSNLKEALEYAADLAINGSCPSMVPKVEGADPIPFAVVPEGHKLHSLDALIFHANRPNPTHTQQASNFIDIGSFIRYVSAYKLENTAVFYTAEGKFTANIDFHEPNGRAAWKHHTASLSLTKSIEYSDWSVKNRKAMTQAEFAEFLDDNSGDLVDAAGMMEVARCLTATKSATFKAATDLHNGSSELVFSEEVRGQLGNSKAIIPATFELEIPVFNGELPIMIKARFRYRVNDGKLELWYVLHRPAILINDRVAAAAVMIQEATGLIPYQVG